ncbi:acyl-CoA dehydrogenase family protein [Streptomyces cavernicola]|uniref:Acyl-CoA dehydrogenase n=1 Tax=Streptomyces cavernicola TaxID=3043613 RepID=A0ABT6S6X7_9ACTN|nr:acyl-CoA dehydrogenase family protein [Streptomyces sp. B-S-A6]MDI3403847.1 acyl-CoA dehydrogenase [Streptomyces sp. B-S-A6]
MSEASSVSSQHLDSPGVDTPAPGSAYGPGPADRTTWLRIASEVADDLAVDAAARDRAGKPPFDEVARLRESGLIAFLTPPGPEGRGCDWRTACSVVRQIAAADSSVGELLGRHYVLAWSLRLFAGGRRAARIEERAVAEQWLWGGATEAAEPWSSAERLTLTPARAGHLLDGRRELASASAVADRYVLAAPHADTGETLVTLVDPAHAGVTSLTRDDRLGQRLAGAGTVTFENVPVTAAHVLGHVPRDEHAISPFTALAPLALRLMLAQVGLGNAEGALAEARDVNRAWPHGTSLLSAALGEATASAALPPGLTVSHPAAPTTPGNGTATLATRPQHPNHLHHPHGMHHPHHPHSANPTGSAPYADPLPEDPYLLLSYGELATSAHTATAVVERASDALARGLQAGPALGIDERAEIAVLVAAAEAVTAQSTLRITARILELTAAADSTGRAGGLDRFWRNARMLTALDSPGHRLRAIGDHYLNGTPPPLTLRA